MSSPQKKQARAMSRVAQYDPTIHKRRSTQRKQLTDREIKFVEIWLSAAGQLSLREAAIEAGYPPASAHARASELTNPVMKPHVVAYIQKRQRELGEKYGTTFERHMKDLLMIRDKAIEAGAWAAAVQAEYRRGQALGNIYVDRKEIRHGTIDSMSKEEVQRKLEELRRLYSPRREVIDVEDTSLEDSIEAEKEADHTTGEEFDEAGDSVLSEDESWDEEDEDNEGRVVGKPGNP
jgi:phage terminase small subunit